MPLLLFALIIVECNAFTAQATRRDLNRLRTASLFELFATQKKEDSKPTNDLFATPPPASQNINGKLIPRGRRRRKMGLMWCDKDYCKDNIRERMVEEHVLLNGPATGQVAYYWDPSDDDDDDAQQSMTRYVLIFVRPGDEKLLKAAADAIKAWTSPTKSKNGFRDKIKVMYVLC